MNQGILSPGLLRGTDAGRNFVETSRDTAGTEATSTREAGWNPDNFAREQIRGLVRQVFFSNAVRQTRQVVFSAIEPETDVRSICRNVGETLAPEISGQVAVVGAYPRVIQSAEKQRDIAAADEGGSAPLRRVATRVRGNLWLIPDGARVSDSGPSASWHSFLAEVRRDFEYSIVQGAPAGESDEATIMAQAADGIILVLSAQHTRRASARRVMQALVAARANILGTVLSDREFPIPEAIYRRL
jgi:hypothetical protein